MTKRILVGLDPSDYSRSAVSLACVRARLFEGTVVGLAIIDLPGIQETEIGTGVGAGQFAKDAVAYHLKNAKETAAKLRQDFEKACNEAGVRYESILEEGDPAEVLVKHSFSVDLLVLGSRTYFSHETQEDSDNALKKILATRACPVMIIPKAFSVPEKIIFPYDGTPESGRAMRLFTAYTAQLPLVPEVLLVHVGDDAKAAEAILQPPTTFLEAHGRRVTRVIESGTPATRVLEIVKQHQPGMVVLGASSKGPLHKLFFGGVTERLIQDGTVPIFVAG